MRTVQKLVAVICNVRSAYNVGSLFRTADAAGIRHLYLCGFTPTPEHPKVAKTALGAERSVPWEYRAQAGRLLKELKRNGWYLVALEQTRRSKDIFSFKPRFPAALIVGNEVRGVSKPLLKQCDAIVEIPMHGKKESLNVSVAAGIALYQLLR